MGIVNAIFHPIIKILRPIIYVPLLNILVFIYFYIPDLGVAIILVTILIRILLLPSFHKTLKQQKAMQALQPKIQAIREKYKNDKQAEAQALMQFYKENDVNPLGSCSTLLLQLPILAALSTLFIRIGSDTILNDLYKFVPRPEHINPVSFGLIDLSAHNNYILVGLAAILTYFQTKQQMPKAAGNDPMQKSMQNSMLYVLPIVMFISILSLPAGLALYIAVTTLFSIAQQYYIVWKETKESL